MQAAEILLGRVRLVARVDDAAVERGLQRNLLLEVVRALGYLEARLLRLLADADPARADDDLAGDEERDQRLGEVLEVGVARVQVVLVAAVGAALAVDVIFVELQWRARLVLGQHGDLLLPQLAYAGGGVVEDDVAGSVVDHGVKSVRAFRAGILRVPVVDVVARAVGGNHVGHPDRVCVHNRHAAVALQVEAAGVFQRGFFRIVPAGAGLGAQCRVGNHRVRGGDQRADLRVVRAGDAVLRLGSQVTRHR